MKCPNCYYNNPEDAKFCCRCGVKLLIPFECPACHSRNIPKDSNFCPDCGALLKKDSIETRSSGMKTLTICGVPFDMIPVDCGSFSMGATLEERLKNYAYDCEWPAHQVTLTNNYYIGKTQVTQALWEAIMANNPSVFKGENKPVECVSWNDCKVFLSKLNSMTGQNFRLPTEAEWEFAARGAHQNGHQRYCGSNSIDDVAWYRDNSNLRTHDVATKQPNELGIYDLSGNVYEWCNDWYNNYIQIPLTNPNSINVGSNDRVCRGGSWYENEQFCRPSFRKRENQDNKKGDIGFRLALSR